MELAKENIAPPPNPQIRLGKIESTLKPKPKFGVYLRWPVDGEDWIHPDDIRLARKLIPSRRIFVRTDYDETYWQICYGKHSVRVQPTMWLEVAAPSFRVGDQVEIKSDMGRLQAQIATVKNVLWNQPKRRVEYQLKRLNQTVPKVFYQHDLIPTVRLGETMPARLRNQTQYLR